jgi:hypothetical protein
MPFQMRDETAGINILYVDNSNQMGLGSLPVNGQALTVQGNGFINQFGDLGSGVMGPGSQSGYEGSVAPGGFTAVVTISTVQQPVTTFPSAGQPGNSVTVSSITTTEVVFALPSGYSTSITYSIW